MAVSSNWQSVSNSLVVLGTIIIHYCAANLYWEPRVIMMPTFLPLVAPEITIITHYNLLQCHQWWQIWHHDNTKFSTLYEGIIQFWYIPHTIKYSLYSIEIVNCTQFPGSSRNCHHPLLCHKPSLRTKNHPDANFLVTGGSRDHPY